MRLFLHIKRKNQLKNNYSRLSQICAIPATHWGFNVRILLKLKRVNYFYLYKWNWLVAYT